MTNRIEFDAKSVQDFVDKHFPPYTIDVRDQLNMVCPFCHGGQHEEVTFKINIESGVANCYRKNKCNFKGTVVFMIKEYLGCGWNEAYKIAGGTPPENIDEVIGILRQAKGLMGTSSFTFDRSYAGSITVMPRDCVPVEDSPIADDFFHWISAWRGYDPDQFIIEHDVYWCKDRRFKGRVIFKVSTDDSYAYQAYTYDRELAFEYDSAKGVSKIEHVRKTLNPPGEVLSRLLYNYNEVKRAATVFICEGIFDAARVVEHGFHAVAIFGCNISVTQCLMLNDLPAKEIIVCLDAGTQEVSMEVLTNLKRYCSGKELSLMTIDVPDADPDNLAQDDFERCFLKRRHVLTDRDAINMLANMENK